MSSRHEYELKEKQRLATFLDALVIRYNSLGESRVFKVTRHDALPLLRRYLDPNHPSQAWHIYGGLPVYFRDDEVTMDYEIIRCIVWASRMYFLRDESKRWWYVTFFARRVFLEFALWGEMCAHEVRLFLRYIHVLLPRLHPSMLAPMNPCDYVDVSMEELYNKCKIIAKHLLCMNILLLDPALESSAFYSRARLPLCDLPDFGLARDELDGVDMGFHSLSPEVAQHTVKAFGERVF
jgi:hypothetical protein